MKQIPEFPAFKAHVDFNHDNDDACSFTQMAFGYEVMPSRYRAKAGGIDDVSQLQYGGLCFKVYFPGKKKNDGFFKQG